MLKRSRRAEAALAPGKNSKSLFGEILDWLLTPLLVLWPLSILFTYNVADRLSNPPYDRILSDNVQALSQLVQVSDGVAWVDFPISPRVLFHSGDDDTVYFQVAEVGGPLAHGDPELPQRPPPEVIEPGLVLFRDDVVQGEPVRVAYLFRPTLLRDDPEIIVQVAETLNRRSTLASSVIIEVLLPQFAIIPIIVLLVWFGLARGIRPLNQLQQRIAQRRPADLSPIEPAGVPDEVRPLIVSFNEMMARLEANLQVQRRFIADAAHQMRTPLTGLKTQAEVAQAERDPAALRRSLEHIGHSAERASHLINQLLVLARAEAGTERIYAVGQVDLDELVREVAGELFPRALEKGIDFGAEGASQPVCVEGSALLLREMLRNLLDNAIKYTPRGGHITIRTELLDGQPLIEISDDGVGIPESERERVFERFHRVLGSTEDGSGLGLPIVREIAELHRASVSLSAGAEGRGTLARVLFAVAAQPEDEAGDA